MAGAILSLVLILVPIPGGSPALNGGDRLSDRDLDALVEAAERRVDDAEIGREERARYLLDVADQIDRAAQAEPSADRRADRWDRAVALIDGALDAQPGLPRATALELQAAVYRWAEGRSWQAQLDRLPTDRAALASAIEAIDDAVVRLRRLWSASRDLPDGDLTAQNVRFRYALALADRAELEDDPGLALDARQQALGRLRDLPGESPLAGHAALLNGRLLVAIGDLDGAEVALRAAEGQPGPAPAERLDARVALLLARKEFEAAIEAIEASGLSEADRDLRAVKVRARQWIDHFPGRERNRVEEDAIARVRRLRDAGHPNADAALAALAAHLSEPDADDDPGRWELLAEGHLARGDAAQAVALNREGADRAEASGDPDRAWLMRYRAAAILVRAGRFDEAAEALGPLAEAARDPDGPAPIDHRANASLLEGLALGRVASEPGAGPEQRLAYEAAIREHLDAFADDPTAGEARWTLGRLRDSAGDPDEAITLWTGVPPDHPRWLDAHLAAVGLLVDAVAEARASGRDADVRSAIEAARRVLDETLDEASDPEARNALEFSRAELDLVPTFGDPERAIDRLDRLVAAEVDADRRGRARRLLIVASTLGGRTAEADRLAREELGLGDLDAIVALASRLEEADDPRLGEASRRRIAGLIALLTGHALALPGPLDPGSIARLRVLRIDALLELGDTAAARDSAVSWADAMDPGALPSPLLATYADALDRLGLYPRAIDAYRLLIADRDPGTPPWFEARYGLAVAYYRTGRPDDARRLIDGTAALHPELGGPPLREKFLRLRRRLDR